MVERNVVASFTGQLFEAAASTKKWTSISSAAASIQIVNVEEERHQLVGLDKDSEVFVHDINDEMQLRSKDNFVQWRIKDATGKPATYGARLKNSQESQRLEGIVGGILAMLETIPSAAEWPTDSKPQANEKPIKKENDVLIKVHLPGKQTTVITVPPSITMEELLSLIVTKRRLDARYYELALPPSKPKSMQAQLLPSTALHTLNITEIHIIKRSKPLTDKKHQATSPPPHETKQPSLTKQRSMTLPGRAVNQRKTSQPASFQTQTPPLGQKQTALPSSQKQSPMTIVTVHLPYDQRTVIQVSPTMTMPQLLVYICEKRNLNPAHHSLVLPSPTSGQMRIVTREMTVSSLRTGVITLVDLKASLSDKPNQMISDHTVSGKKGSFSPPEVKSVAAETSKKRTAPQLQQVTSHDAVDSAEAKLVEKSDKERSPVKHIAKRKAPPPPKGAKKHIAVPSSQPEPNVNSLHGDQAHLTAHTKQLPGSPAKRRAPAVPTAKQPAAEKQMSKQVSDSVLTKHQPPSSPVKRSLPSTTEDVSDNQVAAPSTLATKKRRPAPTRPAPTLPDPHAQHKSELSDSEVQHDDPMDASTSDQNTSQLQQGTKRANRPGSATSAQIRLEITELEASLADVVEEAEWHLQKEAGTKQDHSVDETDSSHTPMDCQPSVQASNKTVTQPDCKEFLPDQMLSEGGTVRGIKGRVKEQIASNQSRMMVEGLMMKKQHPFTRTPLSVVHKAENSDGPQATLKRYGSQETLSCKESDDIIKRSNSLKANQTDNKQKRRGKAPPPPQGKMQAKQPQQIQSEPLDHQSTAAPEGQNITIPAGSNQNLEHNTEALTASNTNKTVSATPDTEKKVPPKVKPKTVRAKSKEAEDNAMVVPEATSVALPEAVHGHPHPVLSKRTKSESYIKHVPQSSPKTNKKSTAVIESSKDGQQVLVLSPAGSNPNKDTSVRIFLPPPPPVLPPCQEEDSGKDTKPEHDTDNTVPVDNAIPNTEHTVVTDRRNDTVTSTMANQLHSDTITSDPTTKPDSLQQLKNDNISHSSANDELEVDSEMEAIEPLPRVQFQSLEDLPPTPPGSPCNELEVAESKMVESVLNDDEIDVIPLPPPLDDINIDDTDGTIAPLLPPDDFDPLSLPPPLPVDDDDDVFDIILPPPSSSGEDDIVATTAAPPPLSTEDDSMIPMTVPPLYSASLDDDIIAVTTEISSQPIDNDKTFQDLPVMPSPPQANDEVTTGPTGDDENDADEIMLNLFPDDVSLSESDTELPPARTENTVSQLETTEPDATIDAAEIDEDEKTVNQPDVMAERITGEVQNTKPDAPVDMEAEEKLQSQDELSNIIASLQNMLQDEPQSYEGQVVDDTNATSLPSTGWIQPSGDFIPIEAPNEVPTEAPTEVPTEAPADVSKDVAQKDNFDQQLSDDDVNQTVKITPTANVEITYAEPKPVAPIPVRAAPPPPPLPPIGKVKTPPRMMTDPTKNTTSPTKAKNPPPAIKPKPKRPISGSLAEDFQDELAAKLKKRQQKIHNWAKDDDKSGSLPQTSPTVFPTVPSTKPQTRVPARSTAPVMPKSQAASVPLMQPGAPNTQPTMAPIGSQQQTEQFQLLQNQMLQQQILQLQQQLQQLQQQLPQGQVAGNPMMAMPQVIPQAGTSMQIPQVGTGMQFPQAANIMQVPQLSTGMQIPMQQQNEISMHNPTQMPGDGRTLNTTSTSNTTTGLNTSADSESSTRPESPPPPLPATSPPPLDFSPQNDQVIRRGISKTTSDSALQQRPSSQVLRSRAFGEYEDALDDILEEVREVDHDTFLKKPPPPPNQMTGGGPHTEMASLLAEAMKQRRINITSKRNSSVSVEEEPDNSHEWD